MKKHCIMLLCFAALSGTHISSISASESYSSPNKSLLMQAVESELAATSQSEQVIRRRVSEMQAEAQSGENVEMLDKQIARERRKLSQLQRTRARLLLKQAQEQAQGE